MVDLRRFLILIVGLLAGVVSGPSFSATYNGDWSWSMSGVGGIGDSGATAALTKYCSLYGKGPGPLTYSGTFNASMHCEGFPDWQNVSLTGSAVCPNGGNITSFTGTSGTSSYLPVCSKTCSAGEEMLPSGVCAAPCVAPQVRQADGTCKAANKCDGKDSTPPSYAWVSFNKGNSPYGNRCKDGCQVAQTGPVSHPTLNPDGDSYVGGTNDFHQLMKTQYFAVECTVGQDGAVAPETPTPADKAPPPTKKPAPCAATEGVLTSSSGTVACVPEGTADARKPDVGKTTKEEAFQDGSTKKTETTTTRDPATNATSTSSTTTTTPAANGQAGEAGTPGTSSSKGGSGGTSGNGDGEGDGNCDPTLNFCGGPDTKGLYEKKEKTLGAVLSTFQGEVKGSPVGQASTQFFNVSAPSGGCPSWVVTVPYLNITLSGAEYFCNGTILAALQAAGAVMLALASYIAFTWAFL